jgi:hypothetical protein
MPRLCATLAVVEDEADEIRHWAKDVLSDVSLKAIARDLRGRSVPTVTGANWSAAAVRQILLRPSVAGIAVHTRTVQTPAGPQKLTTEHEDAWPAILDRDTWEAVTAMLTDPRRRTNHSPGSEPRWLLTGIAACHCGDSVNVRPTNGVPRYMCTGPVNHLARAAARVDAVATDYITAYLDREDNRDLLRPAPSPGVDLPALRLRQAELNETRRAQMRMHAAGQITDDDLAEGLAEVTRLAGNIAAQRASAEPDPLAEFRDGDPACEVWDRLPLARRRAITRMLVTVEFLPVRRGVNKFDPGTVRVTPAFGAG